MTLRPRVALTIYRKELRETLRDRRTLVVMILLPLTLYPLLTLTFASLAASQKREEGARPSQVCMIGAPAPGLRVALGAEAKLQLAPPSCQSGDLPAAERERGTLETLLSAPISRIEIIVSKWLATATIAAITGFLNLGSMGATIGQMLRLVDSGLPLAIPWSAVALAGLAIVPS